MFAQKTAIVVIDVQTGLFSTPEPPFEAKAVIQRINALTDRARAAGVQVCFVQHDGPDGGDWLAPFTPGWRFHPDLKLEPGELVVRKTTGDAFYRTQLEGELRSRGIETIVLLGYATDFCIDSTLRAAASKEFEVVVGANAHTTDDSPALKAEAIRKHFNWAWANSLSLKPIRVVPAEEISFSPSR